jgi:transposase
VSAVEESETLVLVAGCGSPRRRALAQLGLSRSTCCRWLKRQTERTLQDRKGGSPTPWKKLRPGEELKILAQARVLLEISARQLALMIIDAQGSYVSKGYSLPHPQA